MKAGSERQPAVGIVMPVHNRRELTLRCLRSLAHADTSGLCVRTFVVDDGSIDGTSDAIAEQFPEVVVIPGDGSLHYAAGTNRGIAAALDWGADHILAMNDDSIVHPNFLQSMIASAQREERSVIGALLLLLSEPHRVMQVAPQWRTFRGGWYVPEDLTAFTVPTELFPVETIVGNCILYPREAVEECGLLDETNFPCGWGDVQYVARLKRARWRLFVDPKARVWCEPNTYPAPLHTQSASSVLRTLFQDERHPLNMKRQWTARWHSAPSRVAATAAFSIYIAMLSLKALGIGRATRPTRDRSLVPSAGRESTAP